MPAFGCAKRGKALLSTVRSIRSEQRQRVVSHIAMGTCGGPLHRLRDPPHMAWHAICPAILSARRSRCWFLDKVSVAGGKMLPFWLRVPGKDVPNTGAGDLEKTVRILPRAQGMRCGLLQGTASLPYRLRRAELNLRAPFF